MFAPTVLAQDVYDREHIKKMIADPESGTILLAKSVGRITVLHRYFDDGKRGSRA